MQLKRHTNDTRAKVTLTLIGRGGEPAAADICLAPMDPDLPHAGALDTISPAQQQQLQPQQLQPQHGEWSPCPLTVRIEPMPHFAADWQVAQHLRPYGEVVSVRFQRTGEGMALVRFQNSNGAEMALRAQSVGILGHRCFVQPSWCEARFHLWPGHCSADESPRRLNGAIGSAASAMAPQLGAGIAGGEQHYAAAGMQGGGMGIGLAAGMTNAMGGPMGGAGLAAGVASVMRAGVEGGGGTVFNAAGDWKCERCHNLNYAHRTRCNRCHAVTAQLNRPPPTRCPYTVMVSPSDRAKKGLQATDDAVVLAMQAFGEVAKITAFASRQPGAGSHKFVRFRDAGAASVALQCGELAVMDPRGQQEAACIRPAYQRRSGSMGGDGGGLGGSGVGGFGGGGMGGGAGLGGGGGFGMPGGAHDATGGGLGGGLGGAIGPPGPFPLGGGVSAYPSALSCGGRDAPPMAAVAHPPPHHLPPLPTGYVASAAGGVYPGGHGAPAPMGSPMGSAPMGTAALGGASHHAPMHMFMEPSAGLALPPGPALTTGAAVPMAPLHAPPPEAPWQLPSSPHEPPPLGDPSCTGTGAGAGTGHCTGAPEAAGHAYSMADSLGLMPPVPGGGPAGAAAFEASPTPAEGGFGGGLLGAGARDGLGSPPSSGSCMQALTTAPPSSGAGGAGVLPGLPSLGAQLGALDLSLGAGTGGAGMAAAASSATVRAGAAPTSPRASHGASPAERAATELGPPQPSAPELHAMHLAGDASGHPEPAQRGVCAQATAAQHAWPARVCQGVDVLVMEPAVVAAVDASGGPAGSVVGGSKNGPGASEEAAGPPPLPGGHSGLADEGMAAGRSITFLLVTEGSRAPPRMRRVANATSLEPVLVELRAALELSPAAPLVYLAPEFDEWVAMDDLSALPDKCRVRAMVDVQDEQAVPTAVTAEADDRVDADAPCVTDGVATTAAKQGGQSEAPPLPSVELP